MKIEKHKLSLAMSGAICALLILTSGCGLIKAFRTGGETLVMEFASLAEGATTVGTLADLATHPEHRVLFQTSRAALSNFVAGAGTDADSLYGALAILQPLIPALRDVQGNAVILAGAVKLFDAITGWEATVDGSLAVQTIARAILRGLDAALATAPADLTRGFVKAPPAQPMVPTRRLKI